MAGNRQSGGTQVRSPLTARLAALLAAMVALGGCQSTTDTLAVGRGIPLSDSSLTTLEADGSDGFWIAGPGLVVRVDSAGQQVASHSLRSPAPPRWLESTDERLYFHAGSRLTVLPLHPSVGQGEGVADTLSEQSQSPADALAMDPLGRFVYRSGEEGEMVAHDAVTLDPVWGWAAVGGAGSAITLAPMGHRLYQAVAPDTSDPHILVRDLQTGRVLRRVEIPVPVHVLLAAESGAIYAVGWNAESDGSVLALRWRGGDLEVVWRRSLDDLGLSPPVRAELSNSGRLLAVLAVQDEAGLRVLDTEAGRTIEQLRGAALDVGFTRADRLYLLTAGELRRLE